MRISKAHRLRVLGPAHVGGALTEHLALHVDAILADESHASLAAGHAAATASLGVVVRVGVADVLGAHDAALIRRRTKTRNKSDFHEPSTARHLPTLADFRERVSCHNMQWTLSLSAHLFEW